MPLPSSPHCRPMTIVAGISADVPYKQKGPRPAGSWTWLDSAACRARGAQWKLISRAGNGLTGPLLPCPCVGQSHLLLVRRFPPRRGQYIPRFPRVAGAGAWPADRHARAARRRRADAPLAAGGAHDRVANGEAQPGAALFAVSCAVEAVKDPFALLVGMPGPESSTVSETRPPDSCTLSATVPPAGEYLHALSSSTPVSRSSQSGGAATSAAAAPASTVRWRERASATAANRSAV